VNETGGEAQPMFIVRRPTSPDGGNVRHDAAKVDQVIDRASALFDAFARCDIAAVAQSYAEDVIVRSPVLGEIGGPSVLRALAVFMKEDPRLALDFTVGAATSDTAIVTWNAKYRFFPTDRDVRHKGRSALVVDNDRVVRQVDTFDLREWASQAIGPAGHVLSYVPGMRGWISKELRLAVDQRLGRG
jgi:hypothetical protein